MGRNTFITRVQHKCSGLQPRKFNRHVFRAQIGAQLQAQKQAHSQSVSI
jgi:hypothetical protein